jgi:hypothetical protein
MAGAPAKKVCRDCPDYKLCAVAIIQRTESFDVKVDGSDYCTITVAPILTRL